MFSFKEGALAPSGPAPVAFSVVAQGSDSGMIAERKNFRIKSQDELAALWVMVYGTAGPEMPRIDFTKDELLAVFEGTRPTGGYTVAVVSVFDEPGSRSVTIQHEVPGDSCMTSQAITSPFSMVRLQKTGAPLTRHDLEEVIECE
jgi:hypothetical protein